MIPLDGVHHLLVLILQHAILLLQQFPLLLNLEDKVQLFLNGLPQGCLRLHLNIIQLALQSDRPFTVLLLCQTHWYALAKAQTEREAARWTRYAMRQRLKTSITKQWYPKRGQKGSAGEWHSAKFRFTFRNRPKGTRTIVWKAIIVPKPARCAFRDGQGFPYRRWSTSGPRGRMMMCSTQQSTNSIQEISSRWGNSKAEKGQNSQAVQAICMRRMNKEVLSLALNNTSCMARATWQGLIMKSPRFVTSLQQKVIRRLPSPAQKQIFSVHPLSILGVGAGPSASCWRQRQRKMSESPPKNTLMQKWYSGGIQLQQSSPPNCLMPDSTIPEAMYQYNHSIKGNVNNYLYLLSAINKRILKPYQPSPQRGQGHLGESAIQGLFSLKISLKFFGAGKGWSSVSEHFAIIAVLTFLLQIYLKVLVDTQNAYISHRLLCSLFRSKFISRSHNRHRNRHPTQSMALHQPVPQKRIDLMAPTSPKKLQSNPKNLVYRRAEQSRTSPSTARLDYQLVVFPCVPFLPTLHSHTTATPSSITQATVKNMLKMRAATMACHPKKVRAERVEASWRMSNRRVLLAAPVSRFYTNSQLYVLIIIAECNII